MIISLVVILLLGWLGMVLVTLIPDADMKRIGRIAVLILVILAVVQLIAPLFPAVHGF